MFHPGPVGEARAERRRLLAAGRPEPPVEANPASDIETVRDLTRAYFQAHQGVLAGSTLRGHDSAYRRSIDGPLGSVDLRDLTRGRVVAWVASTAQTHSRHGVWKAVTALRTFCKFGESVGLLSENPAARLRLPRAHGDEDTRRGARKALNLEELGRLVAATPSARVECMVRISAECGLRRGELVGLRWADIDLQACRMVVARSVWQEPGLHGAPPVRHVKPPKAGHAKTVAMSPALAERLGDWYAEAVIDAGASAGGYVFPGPDGGPMDAYTPGHALKRACVRAGLVDESGRPLVSWHGLRHTAASIMLANGIPLPDVAAQLRHADPAVTARVYSHSLGEDRQHAAASVFGDLRSARTVPETVREGEERGQI